jgi:hypothetical protein
MFALQLVRCSNMRVDLLPSLPTDCVHGAEGSGSKA